MPLIDLTETNFDEMTESHDLVLLDFWADWCGPCHAFAPIFAAAASRHPDVLFGKINTDAEATLAKQFSVMSVPTLIAAKNGEIIYARPGVITDVKLAALVSALRS